jgi:histidinol-phosphate aminotransferase
MAHLSELKDKQRSALTRPSRETSEYRMDDILWLDKNENMDPQYLAYLKTLMVDLPGKAIFGYPDCHAVYEKLAAYLNVPINQLLISHGSDGIIRAVYEAFVETGDTVIYTNPTFAMYEIYAKISGARAVELEYVPSDSGPMLTVAQVIEAIAKENPKLVCIPNPNSDFNR